VIRHVCDTISETCDTGSVVRCHGDVETGSDAADEADCVLDDT
jgi:hypothetical protein